MDLRVLKGPDLLRSPLAEQLLDLDRRNMQSIMDAAGLEFPAEKQRRSLERGATFIVAFGGGKVASYLDYLRSWSNPDYIYIGSVQIEKRCRGGRLLLLLLDQFRNLVAGEEFTGFETNAQKVNLVAVKLYQKIGFTLERNPRNDASWTARAGKDLLTDSPIVTLLARWHGREHDSNTRSFLSSPDHV